MKSTLTENFRWLFSCHRTRFIQLCLLPIAWSIFAGCSALNTVASKTVVYDPNCNFYLYISNQSFAVSTVDIEVFIDGRLVVKDTYAVGDQHDWQEFVLKLSPGRHKIVAESSKGRVKLEKSFDVDDKLWAALAYCFYPKGEQGVEPFPRQFIFDAKKEPIRFQ